MSTHNISFCAEIRKILILFGGKQRLIRSSASVTGKKIFGTSCSKLTASLVNISLNL